MAFPDKKKKQNRALLGLGVALGAAGLAFFAMRPASAAKPKKKVLPPDRCGRFPWKREEIRKAIEDGFSAGVCDPLELAAIAGDVVYPGEAWPTQAPHTIDDDATDTEFLCLQYWILESVKAQIEGRDCPEIEPPVDYGEILANYEANPEAPRVGFFVDVQPGRNLTWVATAALMNALADVGLDPNIAQRGDEGARLRTKLMSMIECAPWNDGIYGSPKSELGTDANPGGGHWGPHGRGVSFNAVHADNRARILQGKPPRRTVLRGGRTDGSGAAHDGGGHLPFLWIPMLDLERLRDELEVVPVQDFWQPSGVSGSWPPAEILEMGAENVPVGWANARPECGELV